MISSLVNHPNADDALLAYIYHTPTQPTTPHKAQSRNLLGQELLKRGLVNHDVPHGPQALPARLLLVQQFPAARDIAGVQLGQHVLAEGLDGLARDNAVARGRLDDDLCQQ